MLWTVSTTMTSGSRPESGYVTESEKPSPESATTVKPAHSSIATIPYSTTGDRATTLTRSAGFPVSPRSDSVIRPVWRRGCRDSPICCPAFASPLLAFSRGDRYLGGLAASNDGKRDLGSHVDPVQCDLQILARSHPGPVHRNHRVSDQESRIRGRASRVNHHDQQHGVAALDLGRQARRLARNSQIRPPNPAVAGQCGHDAVYGCRWNRQTAGPAEMRRVNSDHPSRRVHQGTAGKARIHRQVGSNQWHTSATSAVATHKSTYHAK